MKRTAMLSTACLLSVMFFVLPATGGTQDEPVDGPNAGHYIGSVLLSLFNVPYKLAICASGQVLGGAAYVMTAGVPGSYDGDTHGPEIGEMATASCSSPWIITPEELTRDYRRNPEPIDYGD